MTAIRNGAHHAPVTRYQVMKLETAPRASQAVADAYNDGTFVGFCLGLLAGLIAWLILSGTLMRLIYLLVRSTLALALGA